MTTAFHTFQNDMVRVNGLFSIYDYLKDDVRLADDITSEILRNQWMYSVSAMDKFIHEIVRVGFIESYKNIRPRTAKFSNMHLPVTSLDKIVRYSNPSYIPSSISETIDGVLSADIIEQTHIIAYQHPDKIKEGLSIVWNETHKFQRLATIMGWTMPNNETILKQKLILISDRRNQIVHQSDMLPGQHIKQAITRSEVEEVIDIISKFCKAIYDEVHI